MVQTLELIEVDGFEQLEMNRDKYETWKTEHRQPHKPQYGMNDTKTENLIGLRDGW